ncbi:MAG: hypothetical protein ABW061_27300 [Polyangiaceae bacterium]
MATPCVYLGVAYRIASGAWFGCVLFASALNACTIYVNSGPASPANGYGPAPVVAPAPAPPTTVVYVPAPTPAGHTPATPVVVRPASPAPPTAPVPPAAGNPYRPTGAPGGRASDLPPSAATPRTPALPSAPIVRPVTAPPATTPP